MRLPWPFGRAQRSPSEGGAASSGPSGGASARPDGGSGSPERGPGDAWRSLPPLDETVGPPPLIAPNRPFAAALAASEPPAPILAPRSHGRSLEAPRGLVAGGAKPVAASRVAELPRPVQRSPLHARRDSGPASDGALDDGPEPEAAAPTPAAAVAPSSPPPAAPAAQVRKLEAITAALGPSANALTRAPEPALARPLGLVGPARVSRAGVQRAPEPAPAPVQPAPIPAPMAPPASVPRPEPDRDRPRLSIGQARRLGLGTPIAGGPISASAPPFAGSSVAAPLPAASPDRSPAIPEPAGIQRSPETPDIDLPLATRPTPAAPAESPAPAAMAPVAPAVDAPLERVPVGARRVGGRAGAMTGPSSPIVSAQPLRSRVQRAPLTLPARSTEESASGSTVVAPAPATGSAGAPVAVHRDSSAAQLSKSLDARSFTHGGDIYLPASHGPLSSGKGRSLLAHELTHVTQQRRLGSSLPEEHTPHGKALEAEAVAAERGADMPLVAAHAPGTQSPAGAGPAADLSAAPAHATSSSAGPSATGPAQRAPANGPGGEPDGARKTHTEQELEDLAGQLYARIGRQLRRELLVDRERAGFAMDLG